MKTPHLLLIDDEIQYSEITKEYLEVRGFKVTLKHDGVAGLETFKTYSFDLCILDIKMPKKDGFTLAEEIRALNEDVPIIFLTGQSLKEDKIKGLKIGADDYLTKPFSMEELYLRIRAILKRVKFQDELQEKVQDIHVFKIGKTIFNAQLQELQVGSKTSKLTSIESKLMKLLFEHENCVLARDVAIKTIWGDEEHFRAYSLNVYISKIRKFLKDDPAIEILSLHGEGYKLINKVNV